MTDSSYICIKQSGPGESGAAAIATLAHHYGLSLNFKDMRSVLGYEHLKMELFQLLFASQKLGFEAVPLEGEFEQLPEVPRPNIISFKAEREEEQFRVLYDIDPESALVGNVETGEIQRLAKDDFVKLWTGDVVQMLLNESEIENLRKHLADLHNPWVRLRQAFGWSPLSLPRLFFLPFSAVILFLSISGFGLSLWPQRLSLAAVGLCLILSVWSSIFSEACKSCSRLIALVGDLPLATAGAIFYLLLFVACALDLPILLGAGLCFASGVHCMLMVRLARARLFCPSCVGVAIFAFIATAFSSVAVGYFPSWAVGAALAGFALMLVVTSYANKLYRLERQEESYRLARKVAEEQMTDGRVRLIVYKRKNCAVCSLFDAVIRPALEQDFGESVLVEERDAGNKKILTPLIIVSGSMTFSMIGLTEQGYSSLKTAIEATLDPGFAALKIQDGMYFLQTMNSSGT